MNAVASGSSCSRDQLGLVVAEADRVLEDNGTAKETKAVCAAGQHGSGLVLSLGTAQKIYPGKWTLFDLKDKFATKTAQVCGGGRTVCFCQK